MRMKWGSRLSEVKRIKWFCRLFISDCGLSGKLLLSDCGFIEFKCYWLYSRFSYFWDSGILYDKWVIVIRYSRLSEFSYISF